MKFAHIRVSEYFTAVVFHLPFRANIVKKKHLLSVDKRCFFRGAGGRTRTGTMSPSVDFESTTSTNSITPASTGIVYTIFSKIARKKFTEKAVIFSNCNSAGKQTLKRTI